MLKSIRNDLVINIISFIFYTLRNFQKGLYLLQSSKSSPYLHTLITYIL